MRDVESLADLAGLAAFVRLQSQYVHWFAKGVRFDRIHDIANDIYTEFDEIMDDTAELALAHNETPYNPLIVSQWLSLDFLQFPSSNSGIHFDEAIAELYSLLDVFIEALYIIDSKYSSHLDVCNYVEDLCTKLQKHRDYKMARRLLSAASVPSVT